MDIFKDTLNNCYQIRTKTEACIVQFEDDEREKIFLEIVDTVRRKESVSIATLQNTLEKKYAPELVKDVIFQLQENQVLKKDNYYPHPDKQQKEDPHFTIDKKIEEFAYSTLKTKEVAVLSSSKYADYLTKNLKTLPFKKVSSKNILDFIKDNQIENFFANTTIDFLVVECNAWNPYYLQKINEQALKHSIPWLYIGGLESDQMRIGPLFYGKETGCFDCLRSRIYSNHDYPNYLAGYEKYLYEKKASATEDVLLCSDLYFGLLAQMATLEVVYFFEPFIPPQTWRAQLIYSFRNHKIEKHTLLRRPHCETCRPELSYSLNPWLEPLYANP